MNDDDNIEDSQKQKILESVKKARIKIESTYTARHNTIYKLTTTEYNDIVDFAIKFNYFRSKPQVVHIFSWIICDKTFEDFVHYSKLFYEKKNIDVLKCWSLFELFRTRTVVTS